MPKQEKETATKTSDDVIMRMPGVGTEKSGASAWDAGKGETADLDAYINNLINTPTPVQVPGDRGPGTEQGDHIVDICNSPRTPFYQIFAGNCTRRGFKSYGHAILISAWKI